MYAHTYETGGMRRTRPAWASEYSEAGPDSCGWIQSGPRHAPVDRCRNAAGPSRTCGGASRHAGRGQRLATDSDRRQRNPRADHGHARTDDTIDHAAVTHDMHHRLLEDRGVATSTNRASVKANHTTPSIRCRAKVPAGCGHSLQSQARHVGVKSEKLVARPALQNRERSSAARIGRYL
jgi:hypothetical protein